MSELSFLKKEHEELKDILIKLEEFINRRDMEGDIVAISILTEFENLWDAHEKREEKFFIKLRKQGIPLRLDTMLIDEHKQLRGHWKVISDAIKSADQDKLDVALDTDGRMLIDKLRAHIDIEDLEMTRLFS